MDPGFPRALGDTIRELRRSRGLTQEQLYFASGLHRTRISDWERAVYMPSLENLIDLAAALDTTPEKLLERAWTRLARNKRSRKPPEKRKPGRPKGT